jgi:hypothetical protein
MIVEKIVIARAVGAAPGNGNPQAANYQRCTTNSLDLKIAL